MRSWSILQENKYCLISSIIGETYKCGCFRGCLLASYEFVLQDRLQAHFCSAFFSFVICFGCVGRCKIRHYSIILSRMTVRKNQPPDHWFQNQLPTILVNHHYCCRGTSSTLIEHSSAISLTVARSLSKTQPMPSPTRNRILYKLQHLYSPTPEKKLPKRRLSSLILCLTFSR